MVHLAQPDSWRARLRRCERDERESDLDPVNDEVSVGDYCAERVAATPSIEPRSPKRDGKPKIDPLFVKAIAGHVYVIHVVDDSRDFYALFRVDALERGDYCTISWKLISDPQKPAGTNASR